jgi:hypothetical protein
MYKASQVPPNQGGPHTFYRPASPTDQDFNRRLSWSEGWASFLMGAIANSPHYINKTNSFALLFDFDFEQPHTDVPYHDGLNRTGFPGDSFS